MSVFPSYNSIPLDDGTSYGLTIDGSSGAGSYLPQLPPLNPTPLSIQLPAPSTSVASIGAANAGNTLDSLFQSAANDKAPIMWGASATSSMLPSIPNIISATKNFIKNNIEDSIFLLLGVILIAAGLFSFKQTQLVINSVGRKVGSAVKTAGETAAAGAAVSG